MNLKICRVATFAGLFLLLATMAAIAQTGTLAGKVRDANNNELLPFANVFINQTTIGTSADKNGNYILTNIPVGLNEIIFSFVGYKSYHTKVEIKSGETQQLDIRLLPDDIVLETVEVKDTRDKAWEKQLKRFERIFLGTTPFASSCKIINPYVLEFKEEELNGKDFFTASASRPIEIENDALGYRINYYMKSMTSNSSGHNIMGEIRFEEMQSDDPRKVKKWSDNRMLAYQGSSRHLFKSIVDGNAAEEGFNLYTDKQGFENATHRTGTFAAQIDKTVVPLSLKDKVTPSKNVEEYIIQLRQRLEVHYTKTRSAIKVYSDITYPVSWIQVNGGLLRVKSNGVVVNPGALIVSGYMYESRVADLLPYNYVPGESINASHSETASPIASKLGRMEEKPYLHFDKPYYYAGEKIWFKAYMNYRTPELIDSLSTVLYVEFINSDKKILQTKRVFIDAGSGEGNISLPENLAAGNYVVRAYTNWMLNYSPTVIYSKVIAVLNEYERPVSSGISVVNSESAVKLKMRNENQNYKVRTRVDLDFEVRDAAGSPLIAELSVAVTDMKQVVELAESNTILNSFSFSDATRIADESSIKYEVEKGINVVGQYKNKKGQPVAGSFFVAEESTGKLIPVDADKIGKFKIKGLMFYDSSTLIFQTPGRKKKFEGDIELTPHVIPSTNELTFTSSLGVTKVQSSQRHKIIDENAQVEQVDKVITEDMIAPPQQVYKQASPSSYGKPDFSISGEEIVKSSRTSLFDALKGRVPGLNVVGGYLRLGSISNFMGASTTEPLLIVDGAQFTGGGPDSNYGRLNQINPEMVERVDVIKYGGAAIYGSRGGNGVIIVTTKKTNADRVAYGGRDELSLYVPINGFTSQQPFSSPDYSRIPVKESYADYRSTIYWNPFVATDNLGNARISFYSAGTPTRYKIVLEGVTASGEPLRGVFYINVIQ